MDDIIYNTSLTPLGMADLNVRVTTLEEGVLDPELGNRVTALEETTSSLTNEVHALDERVSDIEDADFATQINNVSTGVSENKNDIDQLAVRLGALEEIPERISYSTSEQWTGLTWIDGKKIYQKTISLSSPAAAGPHYPRHNISQVNEFINVDFKITTPGGKTVTNNYAWTSTAEFLCVFAESQILYVGCGTDMSTYTGFYVTLQYTCNDR